MFVDSYSELETSLPPIISRTEVPRHTGGLISAGRLANLDCLGQGPKSIRCGRKIAYVRGDFISWLRTRGGQAGAEG